MLTEACIVKAMVFPLVVYGYESWTIKKTEYQDPWTARRSNQSIPKKTNTEYLLERLMLKLQYFGHLMQRANSLEKTLMLGKIEGRRRRRNRR